MYLTSVLVMDISGSLSLLRVYSRYYFCYLVTWPLCGHGSRGSFIISLLYVYGGCVCWSNIVVAL